MAGRERLLELRVATGAPDQKLASGIWRIWQGKNNNDIYVAPRPVAGAVKVSLHASGYCYCGFTKQYSERLLRDGHYEAETIAAHVPLPENIKFQRARGLIHAALTEAGVAPKIDGLVAKLLDGA